MFFFGGAYFLILYYRKSNRRNGACLRKQLIHPFEVPIYFQSIKASSPIGSGVKMLALIIPLTFAAIAQGVALSKIGIVPIYWIVSLEEVSLLSSRRR